jgi:catechol 2,3-dioxygenase-like lactoylglutathione lyase family enzyme
MLHHVQIAAPRDSEDRLRKFYAGVLGWVELDKPPLLAERGGCWFRVSGRGGPDAELHVGIEEDYRPARKAHPAFVVDVDATAAAVEAAGHPVRWADPAEIPGRRRFFTDDPVGNRLEFLEG